MKIVLTCLCLFGAYTLIARFAPSAFAAGPLAIIAAAGFLVYVATHRIK